ncbi:hypothetical protein Sjap_003370 [Stephania japonica]|uniref:Cysteine-rich receptor-like protein kinase n=1 Tax=Stephania japonica TaxID=461633 RepID=A0AAP0PV00_9MAGN
MSTNMFLFIFTCVVLLQTSSTKAQISVTLNYCTNYANNSTSYLQFQANLNLLISSLVSNGSANNGFFDTSFDVSNPNSSVYGLVQCKGGISMEDCSTCLQIAGKEITSQCLKGKRAFIRYENCLFRYADTEFVSIVKTSPTNLMPALNDADSVDDFSQNVKSLMNRLITDAASKPLKFQVGMINDSTDSVVAIYGLAQCTRDLSEKDCLTCLQHMTNTVYISCRGKEGCQAICASCVVRYETNPFFNVSLLPPPPPSPPPPPPRPTPPSNEVKSSANAVKIVVPTAVGVVLLISGCFTYLTCRNRGNNISGNNTSEETLQFALSTMRSATKDFADANKLGKGGFGVVYKGVLPNGQEVAVKRLSQSSGQDITKKGCLDWESRYKIIRGIARGMLYLHEDSRMRIIHRDLKASNILLDDEMNAQISDFGMARLFGVDQTHDKTRRVAGTFGYMAPEYVVKGMISMKSDVYSFGVLMLEIISGQPIIKENQAESSKDLTNIAWEHWKEGKALEFLDQCLSTNSSTDVMKCIHIGLLCIQKSIEERPNMASVVLMLDSEDPTLATPSPPPFLLESENLYFTSPAEDLILEFCSNSSNYSSGSQFQTNLNLLLPNLVSNGSLTGFCNTSSSGDNSNYAIYGLVQCRGDITMEACSTCLNFAEKEIVARCPNGKRAFVRFENCVLRYSDVSFFSRVETSPIRLLGNGNNASNADFLSKQVDSLMNRSTTAAASNPSLFDRGLVNNTNSDSVYGMVQCTRDLSETDCLSCLQQMIRGLNSCCRGQKGGRAACVSCTIRYEVYPFFDLLSLTPPPPPIDQSPWPSSQTNLTQGNADKSSMNIAVIVAPIVVGVLLLLVAFCVAYSVLRRKRTKRKNISGIVVDDIRHSTESLEFDFATIRSATDNFSDGNKLGQGGFGSVYKAWEHWREGTALEFLDSSLSTATSSEVTNASTTTTRAEEELIKDSCSNNDTSASGKQFHTNLNLLFPSLISNGSRDGFFNATSGNIPNAAYGLVQCRGDISNEDCNGCLNFAEQNISSSCMEGRRAYLRYENCILRYSDEPFFSRIDTNETRLMPSPNFASDGDLLWQQVDSLIRRLTNEAASKPSKYESGIINYTNSKPLYGMVQCTRDLSEKDCLSCFQEMIKGVYYACRGKEGCRATCPSCVVRYEVDLFFDPSILPSTLPPIPPQPSSSTSNANATCGKDKSRMKALLIAVPLVEGVVLLFVFFVGFSMLRRKLNKGQDISGIIGNGQLSNGKEIAVKRLSTNSRQGSEEFKNEVMLLHKLQHRNLVKLLGFCLKGKEELLLYEYELLEGYSYLHEDSRLRIIHRDLKASNILLDNEMNPRISDFGMARLFGVDQTHDETERVAGTLGYMAPEYVVRGIFSAKSDVYSFGVLLLEIISGENINVYHSGYTEDLLSKAWQQWREGTALEFLDQSLSSEASIEVIKCIHIGLLCIQKNIEDRPTMASVVLMLDSNSATLPNPSPPPFVLGSESAMSELKFGASTINETQTPISLS